MPAQKRPHDDDHPSPPTQQQDDSDNTRPADVGNNVSDRTPSSSSSGGHPHHKDDEFITIRLSEIRKEVQCPICLGIIRKTRTVMECLHRFCRECIDKSMRMGNNECPACRTHCASRRSLRDDPNYDALIAALYPDIDMYEEEELAFHEEEKARNKQIQASIAQTLRRQTDALGRKRTTARATAAAFARRSQSRRRRNSGTADIQISDDEEEDANDNDNDNDGSRDLSSADEPCTEVKPKRAKRSGGARFSYPSSATDGVGDENDLEVRRENIGASSIGAVSKSERLAWGKGGIRSNTRHGNASGGSGKNARNSRLSKLVNCLRNMQENGDELGINIMLVSCDEQSIPSLQRPFLCCSPSLSIKHLCDHVALQTQFETDDIEILMVKEKDSSINSSTSISDPLTNSTTTEMCKDEMQTVGAQETLGGIQIISNLSKGHMLLAYRPKASA